MKFLPKLKVYKEGQQLPHKLSIVLKEVSQDRRKTIMIIVPSPFTTEKGTYDPISFLFYPSAIVRKIYALRIRFPTYKKFLISIDKTEVIVRKTSEGRDV